MKIDWKAVFISLVVNFFFVALMINMSFFISDWSSWKQATSMPDNAFNEAIRDGFLRQPWNTFSSFAYSFVGVYILTLPRQKIIGIPHYIENSLPLKVIFSFSLIITGLGSAFLHQSLTFVGQTTDVVGMYLISMFIILYALFRHRDISIIKFCFYYIVSNVILFIPLVFSPELRRNLFAALIIIGLLLEYFCNKNIEKYSFEMLQRSACIMLFGFIFWMLDNTKLFFDPYSWFQGHVIWHISGSLASYTLFLHYTNERRTQNI